MHNYTDTGCNISDLGELRKPGDSGDQEECAEGETPLFISGGTVCYNGTSPGSTAVYHCGEGYWLVNEEKTRECQTSGEWSQNSSCMCKYPSSRVACSACTFYAACSVSDLGDTVINGNPSVCDALEIPLFIKGGTVCYNGTTPGSTAVYHCENGIEGYRVLKCQNSGEWDNKTECKPDHAEGIIIAHGFHTFLTTQFTGRWTEHWSHFEHGGVCNHIYLCMCINSLLRNYILLRSSK